MRSSKARSVGSAAATSTRRRNSARPPASSARSNEILEKRHALRRHDQKRVRPTVTLAGTQSSGQHVDGTECGGKPERAVGDADRGHWRQDRFGRHHRGAVARRFNRTHVDETQTDRTRREEQHRGAGKPIRRHPLRRTVAPGEHAICRAVRHVDGGRDGAARPGQTAEVDQPAEQQGESIIRGHRSRDS